MTDLERKVQIKQLEDRICSLRRKNRSLENKVEKMKCCGNCAKYNEGAWTCEGDICFGACTKTEWELE